MEMLSQKQKLFVVVGAILVVVIIIFYYFSKLGGEQDFDDIGTADENIESSEITNEDVIIVHITGAVNNEGIVEVKENARINDVIVAAGGLKVDADLSYVNLAYVVEDGQKIYIPYKEEAEISEINEEDLSTKDAGKGVIKEAESDKGGGGLININSANKDMLTEIPGIGASTAEKIIMYREENGKFKSIEDIKKVSGIGDKKFEAIRSYICV